MNLQAVKDKLAELEITQVQLAELTGYTPPYISAVLNGARPLTELFRIRLVQAVPELWPLIEPKVQDVNGVLALGLVPGVAIVQHEGQYWPVLRDWCPICREDSCYHVEACWAVSPVIPDDHPAMPDGDTIIELRARGYPGLAIPQRKPGKEIPCESCGKPVPVNDSATPPVWCLECYNAQLGGSDA